MTDESEMSDAVLAARIRREARKVKAGEKARNRRAELIREAGRRNWPREVIATMAKVSQQAVSSQIKKDREQDSTE